MDAWVATDGSAAVALSWRVAVPGCAARVSQTPQIPQAAPGVGMSKRIRLKAKRADQGQHNIDLVLSVTDEEARTLANLDDNAATRDLVFAVLSAVSLLARAAIAQRQRRGKGVLEDAATNCAGEADK